MVDKSMATFAGYDNLLLEIKRRIQTAQVRSELTVKSRAGIAVLADRAGHLNQAATTEVGSKGH